MKAQKFEFNGENKKEYDRLLSRYDDVESALLPVLHLAQEQNGYVSEGVVAYLSELMNIPQVKINEVVSFYDMFYDQPVGKNIIQVCTNITCSMFGGRELFSDLCRHFGASQMRPVNNNQYMFQKMECLGACEMAPCMRVNNDYHGKLNLEEAIRIIKEQN